MNANSKRLWDHPSGGMVHKRPMFWVIAAAIVFTQIWFISRSWKIVGIGNLDFAALYETASAVRLGSLPDYHSSGLPMADGADGSHFNPNAIEPSVDLDTLHPPFETLLFLPFTFLPYPIALIIWCTCNFVFLWLIPMVLWKHIPALRCELHVLVAILGLAQPVILSLAYGQDSLLLLLLMSLSFASLTEHRDLRAGMFLALGLFKFHLILPVVGAVAIMRNWRAILGFFAGLAALLVGSFGTMGTRAVLGYFPHIFRYAHGISVNSLEKTPIMPNIRGLVAFIAGPGVNAKFQSIIVVTASAVCVLLLLAWLDKFRSLPMALRFSLVVVITSLISYHYFPHNSVILLLPWMLTANYFVSKEPNQKLRWIFMGAALGFCVASFGFASLQIEMPMLAIDSIVLAVVIFAIPYTIRVAQAVPQGCEASGE